MNHQRTFKATLVCATLALLSATAAIAQQQPRGPGSTRWDYKCRFAGTLSDGKGSSWTQHCKAYGYVYERYADRNLPGHLTLKCGTGMEDAMYEKIYGGEANSYETISGMQIRGVGENAPQINYVIDGGMDYRYDASVTYHHNGYVYTLPGECRFEKHHDRMPML